MESRPLHSVTVVPVTHAPVFDHRSAVVLATAYCTHVTIADVCAASEAKCVPHHKVDESCIACAYYAHSHDDALDMVDKLTDRIARAFGVRLKCDTDADPQCDVEGIVAYLHMHWKAVQSPRCFRPATE